MCVCGGGGVCESLLTCGCVICVRVCECARVCVWGEVGGCICEGVCVMRRLTLALRALKSSLAFFASLNLWNATSNACPTVVTISSA